MSNEQINYILKAAQLANELVAKVEIEETSFEEVDGVDESEQSKYVQANIEFIRRHAWNDFFFFSKIIMGKTLMEETTHKELCDMIMKGLDSSAQLGLDSDPYIKFSPLISDEYVINK